MPFELVQCSRKNSISLKTTKSYGKEVVLLLSMLLVNFFFPLKSLVVVKFYRVQTGISKWVVRDSHGIVGCNTVPGQSVEIQDLRPCFRVSLLHAVLALVRLLLSESCDASSMIKSDQMSPLISPWQDTKK